MKKEIGQNIHKLWLLISILVISTMMLTACSLPFSGSVYERNTEELSIEEAVLLLKEGNERFISGKVLNDDLTVKKRETLTVEGQHPFAVVLTCSDSRVPPEILFDQGLGDLFIVRDAGNVVDPVTLGSVEYGAEHLKAKVVLVLGHSKCGAVKATVDGGQPAGSIGAIVERIFPVVEKLRKENPVIPKEKLYELTEEENVIAQAHTIMKSPLIKELIEKKELKVIGGRYNIETGEIDFVEEIPEEVEAPVAETGTVEGAGVSPTGVTTPTPNPGTITESVNNNDANIIVIPANGSTTP